jgi:hypothetical protein
MNKPHLSKGLAIPVLFNHHAVILISAAGLGLGVFCAFCGGFSASAGRAGGLLFCAATEFGTGCFGLGGAGTGGGAGLTWF